jgi:hypothetical protein
LAEEDKKDFAEHYTKARDIQADVYADDIIDIADQATDAGLARVRIDVRKWHAGKTKPKKYGDKQLGDADNPMNIIGSIKWQGDV